MNTHVSRRSAGFTVIELLVVAVILIAASLLFFYQKTTLQTASLDEHRKTAINAIYYNLEEVYYPKNKSYPAELNAEKLPAVDPALLTDTNGFKINDESGLSEYVYEPTNCNAEGQCKGYTLRVQLAKEGEYVKKSRKN